MKKIVLLVFVLIPVFAFSQERVEILEIIDGSLVKVKTADGEKAVEIFEFIAPAAGQYYFEESKKALEILLNKYVKEGIYIPPYTNGKATVGDSVAMGMIQGGFAVSNLGYMGTIQANAKALKLGIWERQ